MLDAPDKGKVYKTNEQKPKNNITFSVDVYKVTRDINRLQNITTKNQLLICNFLLHLGMA